MLEREEYIEQAYFFRLLGERMTENVPMQELLAAAREEVLSTTNLPLAIDFLLSELKHAGIFGTAMQRLAHYFSPFQTYVIGEAESERGRFDMRVALDILRYEAEYRSQEPSPQGLFMYQFEALCRNRLRYDHGLQAIAYDPLFDDAWRQWILMVRRQVGLIDFADLVYVRSRHHLQQRVRQGDKITQLEKPILFGEKEGKIALANRRKDPLYLFAALQRQLGYPAVPRAKPPDAAPELIPQLMRRVERLEGRIKLLEEEQRGGIDITKFYESDAKVDPPDWEGV